MAVKLITTIQRWLGATADDKPTGAPVGSTFLDHQTGILYVTYDGGTTWVEWAKRVQSAQLPTALAASGGLKVEGVAGGVAQPVSLATLPALVAGTAAIGKLAPNSGVDIGDVDVTSLPAGVLAGMATLPAGSNAIGTVGINSVTAAKLAKTKQPRASITCTNADTDYAAGAAIPAGTKYVLLYSLSAAVVSIGEATSATVGVWIGAGSPVLYPVTATGTAADDTIHAQSPTAGAVVWYSSLQD